MAAKSAFLRGAERVIMIDTVAYRLNEATRTTGSETIIWEDPKEVVKKIREMTKGRGTDVCIDAVGFESDRSLLDKAKAAMNFEKGSLKTLESCMSAVRCGGTVAVLGVYPYLYDNFPTRQFFDKGLTIPVRQAPVYKHIDKLLQYVIDGKVVLNDIISYRLPLSEVAHGYDIFKKRTDGCVKVVLDPWK